jgi:hypothetical protein
LNPGPAPRSGNSDLSVHIGERLAMRGFPVFRFDFAGLGDSSGPTSTDLDAYWSEVLTGRNDDATAALIERIHGEFGIARVLVGGLCAAALPSVRALAGATIAPAGLLLLEPDFRTAVAMKPDGPRPTAALGLLGKRSAGLRRTLSTLGAKRGGGFARAARPLQALLRNALELRIGATLPRDANLPLITLWQESLKHGVPSLVVVAKGQKADHDVTQILASMPSHTLGAVSCERVPGTNHLFTAAGGRDSILDVLERWVIARFGGNAGAVAGLESAC